MATFDITVSGGANATVVQGFGFVVSTGVGAAFGNVPWNTSSARREKVPWLPPAHVPVVQQNGLMNPAWYRALHEVFENRLGGVQGATVTQVQTTVTQTQSQVVATTAAVTDLGAYTRSIDATATALRQVAVDNALSGASTVPAPSDPPAGTIEP